MLPQLRAVVDSLSEGVVIRAADGRLLLCNTAAEAIVGLPAAGLEHFPTLPEGWTILGADGVPIEPGEHAAAVCARTGVRVRDFITGIRRPDGSETWLSVSAQPLPPADGRAPAGVALSFSDVTDARRLADDRERLRRRLHRVTALRLAAAPAMVGAEDQEELLRRTCEVAVRDAGFLLAWIGVPDRAEGIVRPIAADGATGYLDGVVVTLAEDDPRSHGPTGTALREGRAVVNRGIADDETMAPWRERALRHGFGASAAFPLPWNDDQCVLTVYAGEPDFFNDDERALLQGFADDLALALREAAGREFLRTLTENMGEGLLAADAQGRITYVNGAALELLARGREELAGRSVHDVLHPAGLRDAPCTTTTCRLLAAVRAGDEVRDGDDDFARGDGRTLPVAYTATALDAPRAHGTIVVFSDATQRRLAAERLARELAEARWVTRIRDALATDGFVLHAQPIVEVATGARVQHELLLRMADGDDDLILPGAFLPTAEACGLMGEIDRWVIARAARLAHAGHAVEFNLSAASLADPGILGAIEERFAGARGHVVCEVTETAVVTDRALAERFLSRLAQLGIDVALDDFGSGYSGFSYFKTFPAAFLKIDREFVSDLEDHPASRHVVEAIVALARASGKRTVAEGVEDAAQLTLLAELGVDLAQGFGIATPGPVEQVLGGARTPGSTRQTA